MTEKASCRVLGEAVDGGTLQADLARYHELALESGASAAVAIPASDVVVDERVRLKCLVPRCLRAGETPNCPPHTPDLDLIRRAFSLYSWVAGVISFLTFSSWQLFRCPFPIVLTLFNFSR